MPKLNSRCKYCKYREFRQEGVDLRALRYVIQQPDVLLIRQSLCIHGLGVDLRKDLRFGSHNLFQGITNFYIFRVMDDAFLISQPGFPLFLLGVFFFSYRFNLIPLEIPAGGNEDRHLDGKRNGSFRISGFLVSHRPLGIRVVCP